MKSFSVPLKYLLMPLALTLLSGGLFMFQSQALPLLEFSRSAIADGELWRLLTGNLMHSNGWHLLMNVGGLLLATLLVGHLFSKRHFIGLALSNGLAVGVLIYWLNPEINYYVGLSGYLHGLFIYGALFGLSQSISLKKLLKHRSFKVEETSQIEIVDKWRKRIKFDGETYLILLVAIIGKIIYEQTFGASEEMSELINASVATDAHLYGGAVAVLQFVKLTIYKRFKY